MQEFEALEQSDSSSQLGSIQSPRIRELFGNSDQETCHAFPVKVAGRMEAAVLTAFEQDAALPGTAMSRVKQLAEHLTIALEIREREKKLVTQATVDSLTGLPNRNLFMDRLRQAILQARQEQQTLTIAFVDLDRFKNVNDSRGHDTGDKLLKMVASRLVSSVPETDTVARLGGDEFVIIHPHTDSSESFEQIGKHILRQLSKPFQVDSSEIVIDASIGLANYPRDGDDVTSLLRKADLAMYGAKDAGRGRIHQFTPAMEESLCRKVSLESDLRDAIEGDQFHLAYQPQLQIQSQSYIAAEALLRWTHPERGMVSPGGFIPIAESTGYIKILGSWVMSNACRQMRSWLDRAVPIERVAVNVSVQQFNEADFPAMVEQCLRDSGIEPQHLELEVTENVFVAEFEKARQVIDNLKALGVSIAIDDFGTGYSSLNYLKLLPFDIIKIDRSFIADLPENRKSCAIVHAITAMVHTLNRTVLAEGIETDRQLAYLTQLGVGMGQGYYFSEALQAEALEEFLWANHPKARRAQAS